MSLRAVFHVSFSAVAIGDTLRLHKTLIFTVQLRNSIFLKVKERKFKTLIREILRFVHNVFY